MTLQQIIEAILKRKNREEEAIFWKARLRHNLLKTIWFYFLVCINRYTFLKIPLLTYTIWGHKMYAYESSAIGSIYFLGFYDMDVTLFLLKNHHAQGDFVDIGSNIGYYSLLATQFLDPTQKILSIEPTPSTFKVLKDNVKDIKQITPLQLAVSNTEGTLPFIDYGYRYAVFNSSKAHELPFLKNKGEKIEVNTITLDSLCATYNLKPSIIKLDTEGTESLILNSSEKSLRDFSPVILLEVGGGEEWKENNQSSLDLLEEHNYVLCELDTEGELKKHIRKDVYDYKNLVCIPNDKLNLYTIHD